MGSCANFARYESGQVGELTARRDVPSPNPRPLIPGVRREANDGAGTGQPGLRTAASVRLNEREARCIISGYG